MASMSETPHPVDLDRIETLAKAAGERGAFAWVAVSDERIEQADDSALPVAKAFTPEETAFIAEANPATLLAMAAELREARARTGALEGALREIVALERKPFDFPADWKEQIEACDECQRYRSHPIQQGICDKHRRPLWDREKHDSQEQKALIYRAKGVAREALVSSPPREDPEAGRAAGVEEPSITEQLIRAGCVPGFALERLNDSWPDAASPTNPEGGELPRDPADVWLNMPKPCCGIAHGHARDCENNAANFEGGSNVG
jgi:hypothetical protein